MDGFQARREMKKEHIIQTSIILFKSFSPNKVSIRDIADKSNVSPVTIYNYFNNKDGLILEVVREVLSNQLQLAEDIFLSDEGFEDKISQLIFTKGTFINDFHPDFTTMILKDTHMVTLIEKEYSHKTYQLINTFINDAKKEGKISNNVSNELILKIMQLFQHDLSSKHSVLINGADDLKEHETILEILLYGITGTGK